MVSGWVERLSVTNTKMPSRAERYYRIAGLTFVPEFERTGDRLPFEFRVFDLEQWVTDMYAKVAIDIG